MAGGGNRGRPRAAEDHAHVFHALADQLEGVEERRGRDDGGAVLVVMEDGDVERLLQRSLDDEAFGRGDVLQIDAGDGGAEHLAEADDLLRIARVHLDVEHVDPREALEEHPLPFHHRLGGERTDVAQPEHRGAVRDHRHQVTARGIREDVVGIGRDLAAGLGDPRRVG